MNFDRFNPLSSYFSNNGIEVSDWGIEETTSTPSLSSHNFNQPYHHANNLQGISSPTLFNDNFDRLNEKPTNQDFMYYYMRDNERNMVPSHENFEKFIKKYLSLHNITNEFWEKFKYNLIISNLLDDSMILSKTEQSYNNLMFSLNDPNEIHTRYVRTLNFDGTELHILSKQYQLKFSDKLYNSGLVIQTIYMIIFLLKQVLKNTHSRISQQNKMKMFKILLVISTKLIQFKRINLKIQTTKISNMLNDFLVNNYMMNKKLIITLIHIKEMEVFKFMKNSNVSKSKVYDLKENLDNTLNFLIFNLRSSIIKLLPFLNGQIFEKYCHINNINISSLNSKYEMHAENDDSKTNERITIDELTFKLNKFNQLRKFLVCQLLTINEPPSKNFFLFQVWDQFDMNEYEIDEVLQSNFMFFEKLLIIEELFDDHNNVLKNFNSIFDNFEKLNRIQSSQEDINNRDILAVSNQPQKTTLDPISDANMNNLINKLSNISTNLSYFKKYNQSISSINNIDEMNEKLMIFKQFGDELNSIKELYQVNLNDLDHELYNKINESTSKPTSPASSTTSSKRSSRTSGEFNLKSFHTVTSNSIKKRYSLPAHNASVPPSSPKIQGSNFDSSLLSKSHNSKVNGSDKQYKRLSTGLQLGLLTVFEEPNQNKAGEGHRLSSDSNSSLNFSRSNNNNNNNLTPRAVSYDDNYINILPSNTYNDTYNQAALDSLSNNITQKKLLSSLRNSSNNRYSLNSMNSNISGLSELLASTQITTFDENDDGIESERQGLSKEDLKLKLEESFNRIYNLEHENESLKLISSVDNTKNNTSDNVNTISSEHDQSHESNRSVENSSPNREFLSELETTLSCKIPDK